MAKIVPPVVEDAVMETAETAVEVVQANAALLTPKRVIIAAGAGLLVVGGVMLYRKFRKHGEEVVPEAVKS